MDGLGWTVWLVFCIYGAVASLTFNASPDLSSNGWANGAYVCGFAALNVIYWATAFPSREARDKAFRDFGADPEWQKVREESEKNGKLTVKVEYVILMATDYSPIK